MRRRLPATQTGTGGLPDELAAGPDPVEWSGRGTTAWAAWSRAGEIWSHAHGHGRAGWRELLSEEVRYATSSLGRAAARHGGYVPPWETVSGS